MTDREQELLEALRALLRVTDRTAAMLEEECPALAEVGYWLRDDKDAYERARALCGE
jgi:hypothetical protein